jgi:hypothetical protein
MDKSTSAAAARVCQLMDHAAISDRDLPRLQTTNDAIAAIGRFRRYGPLRLDLYLQTMWGDHYPHNQNREVKSSPRRREAALVFGQVRSGRIFERRIGQERACSRIDPLLLGLADYASLLEAVGLYQHQSRRRGVFDRKD